MSVHMIEHDPQKRRRFLHAIVIYAVNLCLNNAFMPMLQPTEPVQHFHAAVSI